MIGGCYPIILSHTPYSEAPPKMHALITAEDAMGRRTDVLATSTMVLNVFLIAGAAKLIPVPPGARHVLFSATGNFWVRFGGAVALPVSDIIDGSGPELNPAARTVDAIAALGMVAPADCAVSLAFYG